MARHQPPKHKRNELKRIVLSVLENRGWLSTPMIRHLAGWVWRRPLNYHLARYQRWHLVKRKGTWNAKPIYWRLTREGEKKLAWLRRTMS